MNFNQKKHLNQPSLFLQTKYTVQMVTHIHLYNMLTKING